MMEVWVDEVCHETGQQQQPEWPNDKLMYSLSYSSDRKHFT